jgi:hypothetical protein
VPKELVVAYSKRWGVRLVVAGVLAVLTFGGASAIGHRAADVKMSKGTRFLGQEVEQWAVVQNDVTRFANGEPSTDAEWDAVLPTVRDLTRRTTEVQAALRAYHSGYGPKEQRLADSMDKVVAANLVFLGEYESLITTYVVDQPDGGPPVPPSEIAKVEDQWRGIRTSVLQELVPASVDLGMMTQQQADAIAAEAAACVC